MKKELKGFGLFDPIPKILGYILVIPAIIGIYAFLTDGEGKFHDTLIEIAYVIAFIIAIAVAIGLAYTMFWFGRELIDWIKGKNRK